MDDVHNLLNKKKQKMNKDVTTESVAKTGKESNVIIKDPSDILSYFNHGDYDITKPVYIDKDLHEVLMIIKNNSKFTMGEIASSILEMFVKENIVKIENLNVPTNKYLNK